MSIENDPAIPDKDFYFDDDNKPVDPPSDPNSPPKNLHKVTVVDAPPGTQVEQENGPDGKKTYKIKLTPPAKGTPPKGTPAKEGGGGGTPGKAPPGKTPPKGDGNTTPPNGDGNTTPPKGDGNTTPPKGDGNTTPPNGGTTPPNGGTSPKAQPNDGNTTPPKDEYTSHYKEGEYIDDDLLNDLEAKGGTRKDANTVTYKGRDYKKDKKITLDQADDLTAGGVERKEKDVGYYHKGDEVTPEMEKDLLDRGYTKTANGYQSPDGKYTISGSELTEADAKHLTENGIKKSSAYTRNDPDGVVNNNPSSPNYAGNQYKVTQDYADKIGYKGETNPDHGYKPKVGPYTDQKNEKGAPVYEYNTETKQYEVVGEVHKENGKDTYFAYNEDQKKKVNVDKTKRPGDPTLWNKP